MKVNGEEMSLDFKGQIQLPLNGTFDIVGKREGSSSVEVLSQKTSVSLMNFGGEEIYVVDQSFHPICLLKDLEELKSSQLLPAA